MTEKNMDNDFNFDKTGRRMPYTVPENFFDDIEERILHETVEADTAPPKRRRSVMRVIITAVSTAAAAVAMLLVFTHITASRQAETVSYDEVEQAFANLSSSDQDYILQVYQDDIFINE